MNILKRIFGGTSEPRTSAGQTTPQSDAVPARKLSQSPGSSAVMSEPKAKLAMAPANLGSSVDRPVAWVPLPSVALPGGELWDSERGYRFMLLLVRLANNSRTVHFKFSDIQLKHSNSGYYWPIGLCCSLTSDFKAAVGQPIPSVLTTAEAHLEQGTDHYGVLFAIDDREDSPSELEFRGQHFSELPLLNFREGAGPLSKVDTSIRALSAVAFKDFVPFANQRGAVTGFHEFVNPSRNGGVLAIGQRGFDVFETDTTQNLRRENRTRAIVAVRIPDGVGSLRDALDTSRISARLQDGTILPCVGMVIRSRRQYDPKPTRMILSSATLSATSTTLHPSAVASYEDELLCPVTAYTELERKAVILFDDRLTTESLAIVKINDYEAHLEHGTLVYAD